jgi:hypothetical protein
MNYGEKIDRAVEFLKASHAFSELLRTNDLFRMGIADAKRDPLWDALRALDKELLAILWPDHIDRAVAILGPKLLTYDPATTLDDLLGHVA